MAVSKAAVDKRPMIERIRAAAIALFKARGYHGTPVRELAQAVHIETASLYYHFASKQEILFDLIAQTIEAMLDGVQLAIASESTPEGRLRVAVRFHVLYHIARQDEAFVSHSELRSLSRANYKRILVKRDRYEKFIRALLADGVRSGAFEIDDVPLTGTAILTMCSGVSDWFARRGRLTPAKVADHYANLVIRLVAAK